MAAEQIDDRVQTQTQTGTAVPTCECCAGEADGRGTAATRGQVCRDFFDDEPRPTHVTLRCDDCAQALRDYTDWPGLGITIAHDEPLVSPGEETR